MSFRIAIIGGGPGGVTLARLLQVNNLSCTVFELDNPALSRSQGGSLDLHVETGQKALKEAGLFDEFNKYMRLEGAALRLISPSGDILLDLKGEGDRAQTRPEIDRRELRELLIKSLLPGTIQWERKLSHVETKSNGKFDLHFADGKVEEDYDLVIGADGAWSKVRSLFTDVKPHYSGTYCFETRIEDINNRFPEIGDIIGTGSCFYIGDAKSIMAQRNGDGSVRIYAMVCVAEDWGVTSGINWEDYNTAVEELLTRHFANWNEMAKSWMRKGDEIILRPLYMLPIGLKWSTKSGVTLLGDAAHLMTPFTGVGVNLAMADALDLCKAIVAASRNEISLLAAIEQYDNTMFERSAANAQRTMDSMSLLFGGKTAEEIANVLKQVISGTRDFRN